MWDERYEKLLRHYLPFLPAEEPVDPDADLRDYGLDSLGIVDLLSALEQTFQVRFTDDLLTTETFRTPNVLWQAMSGLIAGQR